jgi:hypothetical protein
MTDELNRGAAKLRKSGRSAAEIAALLADRGVEVTRMTASNYRRGRTVPPENVRAIFAAAPFYIPITAWDRPAPAAPALAVPKKAAPPRVIPKKTASVPPAAARTLGGPAATRDTRSAATLAAELLTRIEAWREAAERDGTPAAAHRFAQLEGRAIERLAKLRGEAVGTEGELVRSPQWVRLRAEILSVVGEHPPTARKLLAVLEAHGHAPHPGGV